MPEEPELGGVGMAISYQLSADPSASRSGDNNIVIEEFMKPWCRAKT
jgi:hypothetical protein